MFSLLLRKDTCSYMAYLDPFVMLSKKKSVCNELDTSVGRVTCAKCNKEQPISNRSSSAGLSTGALEIDDGGRISTALQSLSTHSMSMTVLPAGFFDSSSTFRGE